MLQTKGTVLLVCSLCGLLEIRYATALTTGAKHWHRQKAVFYVFCFSAPQYLSTESIFPLTQTVFQSIKKNEDCPCFTSKGSLYLIQIGYVGLMSSCTSRSISAWSNANGGSALTGNQRASAASSAAVTAGRLSKYAAKAMEITRSRGSRSGRV